MHKAQLTFRALREPGEPDLHPIGTAPALQTIVAQIVTRVLIVEEVVGARVVRLLQQAFVFVRQDARGKDGKTHALGIELEE